MSQKWGSGYVEPSYEEPDPNRKLYLHNYQGPYSKRQLASTRDALASYVKKREDLHTWQKINYRTSIAGFRNERSDEDGYGHPSTMYSHAGIPDVFYQEYNDEDNETDISTDPSKPAAQTEEETSLTVVAGSKRETSENSKMSTGSTDLTVVNPDTVNTVIEIGVSDTEETNVNSNDGNGDDDVIITHVGEVDPIEIPDEIDDSPEDSEDDGEPMSYTEVAGTSSTTQWGTGVDTHKYNKLKEMYQCQTCQYVDENRTDMMNHLKDYLHHRASYVYVSRKTKDGIKVKYLINAHALVCPSSAWHTAVYICPNVCCDKLFVDALSCANHNLHKHTKMKGEFGQYALAYIVHREEVKVSAKGNTCNVCDFSNKKVNVYLKHCKDEGHLPFIITEGFELRNLRFVCCYCDVTTPHFSFILFHVKTHQDKSVDGQFSVVVLTYAKEKRMVKLPHYTPDKQGQENSILGKIECAKQDHKLAGKKRRSHTREELKKLIDMLATVKSCA